MAAGSQAVLAGHLGTPSPAAPPRPKAMRRDRAGALASFSQDTEGRWPSLATPQLQHTPSGGGGQPRTLQLLVLAPVPAEPSHLILFLAFFPVGAPATRRIPQAGFLGHPSPS